MFNPGASPYIIRTSLFPLRPLLDPFCEFSRQCVSVARSAYHRTSPARVAASIVWRPLRMLHLHRQRRGGLVKRQLDCRSHR